MDFETYRQVYQLDQLDHIVALLKRHNIPYDIEKTENIIDKAIVGNSAHPPILLKLPPDRFEVLTNLMIADILEQGEVPDGYYLKDFSDEELEEILLDRDSWSPEDYALSQLILAKRGRPVDQEKLKGQQAIRAAERQKGKPGTKWLMAVYAILVVVGALTFVPVLYIAGTGMGYYYWKGYKLDDTGQKYPIFDPSTQRFGGYLFKIGLALSIISVIVWISLSNMVAMF
jgi:hypothetical protein